MNTLQDIKARASAATPGPWVAAEEIDGIYAGQRTVVRVQEKQKFGSSRVVTVGQTRRHISRDGQAEANVEFIAHAREDVPKLVAALEAVQEVVDRTAPFHLNQDGENGWQCAIDHIESAIDEALEATK